LDSITDWDLIEVVFGVAPVSYNLDSNSDFNPVKALSFKVALADASAFHVLLSAGANDIAALHGRQDSEDAIKHRGISISLVNKRLSMGDASDRALAAVTLLAGNEVSNCYPPLRIDDYERDSGAKYAYIASIWNATRLQYSHDWVGRAVKTQGWPGASPRKESPPLFLDIMV
jgi:hypothetical protein